MNIKSFKLLIPIVLVSFVLAGCFDEIAGPYDGPDKVAFSQVGGGYSTSVSTGQGTVSLQTELVGPQRSASASVGVGVVTEEVYNVKEVNQDDGSVRLDSTLLALPTTAQEGVHYELPDSYTFPANASLAPLDFQVLDADIDAPVRLTIRLDGAPDLEPAELWRYFTITIQPSS